MLESIARGRLEKADGRSRGRWLAEAERQITKHLLFKTTLFHS